MTKTCIICGKVFEPFRHLANRQKCCSKECSKVLNRHNAKEYSSRHRNALSDKMRHNKDEIKPLYCSVCGEQMFRKKGRWTKKMHDECVIRKCAEYIKAGQTIPKYWYTRCYAIGLEKKDIQEAAGIKPKCVYCGNELKGRQEKYCSKKCRSHWYYDQRRKAND